MTKYEIAALVVMCMGLLARAIQTYVMKVMPRKPVSWVIQGNIRFWGISIAAQIELCQS